MIVELTSILIVEDEAAHADAIARVLAREISAINLRQVRSLREYRQAVTAELPDIVLMDLHLPDGRATDALIAAGEDDPFPVVVMTAGGSEAMAVEALKAGARDYIVKSPETFAAAPQTLLRVWREWQLQQARKEFDCRLAESEARYRQMFEANPQPMWVYDLQTLAFLAVNNAAISHYGYNREEFLAMTIREIRPPEEVPRLLENVRQVTAGVDKAGVWSHCKKDGSRILVEITSHTLEFAGRPAELVLAHDVTEHKRAEAQLRHLATHDELTGVANRTLLNDRLEQSIYYARGTGRLVAMLLLDLDRFRIVNDSLGHEYGDRLLCAAAKRLLDSVRDVDTVARLGGDEFVVLLTEVANVEDVMLLAKKILDRLHTPYQIGGREVTVTASLGISLFPRDGDDGATLIRNADLAMYRAKRHQCNDFSFYSAEMNRQALEILELESALRHALARGEFQLYYQPKVALSSRRIVGVEALVRWQHPQRGLVSPADFIPLAEETGLIVPIGSWILTEACRQVRAWQEAGLPALTVAVNLSARQFRTGTLPQLVVETLQTVGLEARFLDLELTESMVMDDPAGAEQTMRELKSLGVSLSLDDFGTGYSSLNYLRRFPVDSLKIDRSFIRDVVGDPSGASVVKSVIDIAHNLGLIAVAEGVETGEQLAFLADCGCDIYQGYLFSKPLPALEFADLLGDERWQPRSFESKRLAIPHRYANNGER